MSRAIKRIVLGLATAAMAVALAGGAYAAGQNNSPAAGQGPGAGRFGGPGGPFGRGGRGGPGGPGGPLGVLGPMMLNRLDLSSDQRDRVKQIADSHRDEQQAIRQRAVAAQDALQTAVTSAAFDEGVIRARAADVAAVEADAAVARARIFAEAYQILTSEQQTKLKAMQAERHQRQGRHRP